MQRLLCGFASILCTAVAVWHLSPSRLQRLLLILLLSHAQRWLRVILAILFTALVVVLLLSYYSDCHAVVLLSTVQRLLFVWKVFRALSVKFLLLFCVQRLLPLPTFVYSACCVALLTFWFRMCLKSSGCYVAFAPYTVNSTRSVDLLVFTVLTVRYWLYILFTGGALWQCSYPVQCLLCGIMVEAKKLEHAHPDIQHPISEPVQVPILIFSSKVGTFGLDMFQPCTQKSKVGTCTDGFQLCINLSKSESEPNLHFIFVFRSAARKRQQFQMKSPPSWHPPK